jgi:hypothetical protein
MGQIFHLALYLKQYVLGCFSPIPKPSHPLEPKTIVALVAIDPHMAIISVHVRKNLVKDVLMGDLESILFPKIFKKN